MGVDGDPAGRVPSPTFTPHPGGLAGEARARDLISGCWMADVLPFGQIDIPIWIQFSSEPLVFLPHPASPLAGGWGAFSHWLAVSWSTWGPGLPLLADFGGTAPAPEPVFS